MADADDVCPAAYDPHQWDEDGDGMGDSCDECPLTTDAECESLAGDIDTRGT